MISRPSSSQVVLIGAQLVAARFDPLVPGTQPACHRAGFATVAQT
jgi:hypothetical protein